MRSRIVLGALLGVGCVPGARMGPVGSIGECPGRAPSGVRWISPEDAAERRELDRWCRPTGPIDLVGTPDAATDEAGGPVALRVVSWNAEAGGGDLLAFVKRELGLACGDPVRGDGQPDHFVLLIQEALRRSNDIPVTPRGRYTPPPISEGERSGPRLGVPDVARACGLAFVYVPATRNGWAARNGLREDRGNAILSNLPLRDPVVIDLPVESIRRVVAVASVMIRGRPIRFASVHLITFPPPWRVVRTLASGRHRQARALVAALRQLDHPERTPLVVAGDLNTWSRRETTIHFLHDALPDSPPPLATPTRGPFPTDHIFLDLAGVGEFSGYRVLESDYASDHFPIAGELTVSPAGGR